MEEKRIFMDHAAGVAVDAAVLEAMLPYLGGEYGNPSSLYKEGVRARRALDEARERVAACLGAHPEEIIFTSGGTESDNWAVQCGSGEGSILSSDLEHPAVWETTQKLARQGREVVRLPVLSTGVLDVDALQARLARGGVSFVTLMHANHETGVIQPVTEAVEMAHAVGARLLCDAVQSAAFERIDAHAMGVDYLSISGHKLGAPRGIGVLYVRRGLQLPPLIYGGGQERGKRSGTESVALAMGLAVALERARDGREAKAAHVAALSAQLLRGLCQIDGVMVNGWAENVPQLPGTVNVSIDCVSGGALTLWMDRQGVCISPGSACSAAGNHPSRVLLSMGRDEKTAMSAVRFSLGEQNTSEEVEIALNLMRQGIGKLRSLDLEGSFRYGEMG